MRSAVWAASLDLARDLALRGVAAVHFLFDASGHFHFVGMRPGLAPEQVREYPYTKGCKIFGAMRPLPGRRSELPEDAPSMPLMFGFVARKPA